MIVDQALLFVSCRYRWPHHREMGEISILPFGIGQDMYIIVLASRVSKYSKACS